MADDEDAGPADHGAIARKAAGDIQTSYEAHQAQQARNRASDRVYNSVIRPEPIGTRQSLTVNETTGERTEGPKETLMGRRIPPARFNRD